MRREDLNEYTKIELSLLAIEKEIETTYNTYRSPSFVQSLNATADQDGPTCRALNRIEKLKKRRDELSSRLEEIENFVDSIEDPEINAACTLHYINGYTWEATCYQLRKHHGGSMIIEKVRQYFLKKGYES
ncbi:MAG: hypothetical protein IKG00_00085 [Lachnospiraceae bacterium]|nr:hypothetical protein [Lachnospiraceae bacterium]